MPQKLNPKQFSEQTSAQDQGSSAVQSRDLMQDLIGNEAIQQIMSEEMSAEECERYAMWVPEIQRCLATGAAPNSAMGNALIGIIGTKLLGLVAGGTMGTGMSSGLGQSAIQMAAGQAGVALSSLVSQGAMRSKSD